MNLFENWDDWKNWQCYQCPTDKEMVLWLVSRMDRKVTLKTIAERLTKFESARQFLGVLGAQNVIDQKQAVDYLKRLLTSYGIELSTPRQHPSESDDGASQID